MSYQDNLEEMKKLKPLPVGKQEFHDWADNIIAGTYLPANPTDQKFALTQILMHLGPTVDHECDGYFIKSLRKAAINQVADALAKELRDMRKKELEQKEQDEATHRNQSCGEEIGHT